MSGLNLSPDKTRDFLILTATTEIIGISCVMSSYHFQDGNIADLELGRKIGHFVFPKTWTYFDGTTVVK